MLYNCQSSPIGSWVPLNRWEGKTWLMVVYWFRQCLLYSPVQSASTNIYINQYQSEIHYMHTLIVVLSLYIEAKLVYWHKKLLTYPTLHMGFIQLKSGLTDSACTSWTLAIAREFEEVLILLIWQNPNTNLQLQIVPSRIPYFTEVVHSPQIVVSLEMSPCTYFRQLYK